MRMLRIFPMVTPSSVTGAPLFNPEAFWKYVRRTSLRENKPPSSPT